MITADMIAQLMTIVGVLAFIVSTITEVTKSISFLKKVPTDLMVIVLSVILTVVAFIAYAQYVSFTVIWYWIVAAVVCGFFVAFIAMYGWSKLTELWTRFNNKK